MLLLCGLNADAVGSIYPSRIALTGLAYTLAAMLIALIMGAFSLIAVGVGICAAGVTCITTFSEHAIISL